MGATVVIDVVIGLVLMYLLLSLICTIINEFIASLLKLRARNLRAGIDSLIDDPNLRKAFQATGIIDMSGQASGRVGPSYLPSKTFALGLFDALDPSENATVTRTIADVKGAIDRLPESSIKGTLASLARDAGDNIETYRLAVSAWFDGMMERLGGAYKRWMQLLSLTIALILAVAVNADSVQVAKALWSDELLRTSIADSASSLATSISAPEELADLAAIDAQLRPLPIGWNFESPGWSADWYRSWQGWLLKIFGLAFTAAAVSLGAPFWFDLLNKFTRIRTSGGKPDKSPQA